MRLASSLFLSLTALAACGEITTTARPSITFFGSDYAVITSGPGADGEQRQGAARLTWQLRLTERIELWANEVQVSDLESVCVPTVEGSPCMEDGSIVVRPTQDTTYRLVALAGDGDCSWDEVLDRFVHPDQCNTSEITVQAIAPAVATLSANPAELAPGGAATIDYSVQAKTWSLGWISQIGGVDVLNPCPVASEATATDLCALPELPDATNTGTQPNPEAQITLSDLQETVTFAIVADNLADDDAGRLRIGEVTATVTVTPP